MQGVFISLLKTKCLLAIMICTAYVESDLCDLLDHIETHIEEISLDFPNAHIVLAGDFNTMPNSEVIMRTGMMSIVAMPTRGDVKLDRIYTSALTFDNIKVITSTVKSDHKAILAYAGEVRELNQNKTRRHCTFRRHSPAQHAQFLASEKAPIFVIDPSCNPQDEFDRFYEVIMQLLNTYYPERSITITSADPPYVSPAVKMMLRQKNKLMRAGKLGRAESLAAKIGAAIIRYNSTELKRVDVTVDSRSMWAKVRQLTGKSKSSTDPGGCPEIKAEVLNNHHASISSDAAYRQPHIKQTVNCHNSNPVSEFQMFNVLDRLRPTSTGLDNLPSWFLQVGAPLFAAPCR